MQGYWQSTTPGPDPDSTDYAWINEDGRLVQRINYDHGGYVMRLWFEKSTDAEASKNQFDVWLKPKTEPHHIEMFLDGEQLVVEHADLTAPRTEYQSIEEADLPKSFVKDLAWANKTMDKMERDAKK